MALLTDRVDGRKHILARPRHVMQFAIAWRDSGTRWGRFIFMVSAGTVPLLAQKLFATSRKSCRPLPRGIEPRFSFERPRPTGQGMWGKMWGSE
jgi:hypothetical protein